MLHLTIRIKKKADGSAALSCIRPDGTVTWHRQEGSHGAFFPLHDLTPYAVETVLGPIRARRAELFERWRAVPAGEALELAFPDQAGVAS